MNVLAVLWTVCLVKLCYSGSDLQPQNSPEATGQESTEAVKPLSPFLTKVDGSLFDLEEAEEDAVKVLKLTVKNGGTTKKVRYDGEEIWSARAVIGSPCSSVVLYFDGEKPTLAVINTKGSSGKEGTVYKHLDGSKWKNSNEGTYKKKLEALKEDCRPIGKPEDNPPVSSAPLEQDTLNISRVDQSNLKYFEYIHDDNLIQLIAPKKGVSVQKIVRGSETVWTADEEEKLEYSKLYLDKNRKLGLILITSNVSSDIKYNYFVKNGTKWERAVEYVEKMKAIKIVSSSKTDMSIDLEREEDTDECRVLDVELLNVPTCYYLPKPEYHSNSVKSGEDVLWEAVGDEKCTSCAVYSKNGNHLLSLFIKDGDKSDYKHFEKADGTWSFISEEEFNKKYKNMQVTASQTSGDATFTESKEVDKEEPDQQSGDNAAGPVTDVSLESWDTKSESFKIDGLEHSPTEESVLVGPDKNEETATEHEDIPHQSFSSHSDEQLQTGEETTQSEELPESAESPTEVTTVEHEEQDSALVDSKPEADTKANEYELLNDVESSQEVTTPSTRDTGPEVTPYETSATETLDLTDPDGSKVDIVKGGNNGVRTKKYSPKPGHNVVWVKDGKASLWYAQPHYSRKGTIKVVDGYDSYCLSCVLYKKGNVELLELTLFENASSRWYKYFEKTVDGKWISVEKDNFFNKLNEMRKSGSLSPNPSTTTTTTPSY